MAGMSETEVRLRALERRMAALEGLLQVGGPSKASFLDDVMPGPPLPPPPPTPVPAAKAAPRAKVATALPPTIAGHSQEIGPSRGGGDLLGFAAVICFVLAGAWLVKLAIDNGWLDPARRIILTNLAGFSLIGAGFAMRGKDREYSSYLPAAGITLLYMAAYAGHLLYNLYDPLIVLVLVASITVVALGLYAPFRSPLYPLLAQIGCYVVPLAVPGLRLSGSLSLYYIVWDITFTILALATRERRLLPLAGYLALGSYAVSFGQLSDLEVSTALIFQAAQMGIFLIGSLSYTLYHSEPMGEAEAWLVFPLLLFFYGIEYAHIEKLAPGMGAWSGLAWGALLVGAYALVSQGLQRRGLSAGPMVSTYVSLIVFQAAYLVLVPGELKPWVGLLVLVTGALLLNTAFGKRHIAVPALLLLAGFMEYGHVLISYHLERGNAAAAGLCFGALLLGIAIWQEKREQGSQLLDLGLLGIFAAANAQVGTALSRCLLLMDPAMPGPVHSVAWAAYGFALMGLAWGLRAGVLAQSALGVLLIAAAKALLVDTLGAAAPVRIVSFLSLGALLYGAGYLYRHVRSWA